MTSESAKEKFINSCSFDVMKANHEDCIYFIGSKNDRFYMNINNVRYCMRPKKYGYFLRFPERYEEVNCDLKNTCGKVKCINPLHMISIRPSKGDSCIRVEKEKFKRHSKLTHEQVRQIKTMIQEEGITGEKITKFAEENGIKFEKLLKVSTNKRYKKVT